MNNVSQPITKNFLSKVWHQLQTGPKIWCRYLTKVYLTAIISNWLLLILRTQFGWQLLFNIEPVAKIHLPNYYYEDDILWCIFLNWMFHMFYPFGWFYLEAICIQNSSSQMNIFFAEYHIVILIHYFLQNRHYLLLNKIPWFGEPAPILCTPWKLSGAA